MHEPAERSGAVTAGGTSVMTAPAAHTGAQWMHTASGQHSPVQHPHFSGERRLRTTPSPPGRGRPGGCVPPFSFPALLRLSLARPPAAAAFLLSLLRFPFHVGTGAGPRQSLRLLLRRSWGSHLSQRQPEQGSHPTCGRRKNPTFSQRLTYFARGPARAPRDARCPSPTKSEVTWSSRGHSLTEPQE